MNGILGKIEGMLSGKKTWIVTLLIVIGAVLKYQGIDIPEFVWPLLGALGLGGIRSAIKKVEPKE